jgi:hypothetical protein
MATYTLTKIDDKLWRDLKSECAYRGVSIRGMLIDRIRLWTEDSKRTRKAEERYNFGKGRKKCQNSK